MPHREQVAWGPLCSRWIAAPAGGSVVGAVDSEVVAVLTLMSFLRAGPTSYTAPVAQVASLGDALQLARAFLGALVVRHDMG